MKRALIAAVVLTIVLMSAIISQAGIISGWSVRLDGLSSARLLSDGRIALAAGEKLLVLTDEGKTAWSYEAEGEITCVASDDAGGAFAAYGERVTRLGPNGERIWDVDLYGATYSMEAVNDVLLVGWEHGLLALDPLGNLKWEYYKPEDC